MKKSYFWLFGIVIFAQSWALGCELDGVDMGDADDSGKYTIVSDKDAHFADAQAFNHDMEYLKGAGFVYSECKDSMIWRVLKAKNSTKVYVALMTDEDDCDGGNSYGVLFYDQKPVGTIDDSVISCK